MSQRVFPHLHRAKKSDLGRKELYQNLNLITAGFKHDFIQSTLDSETDLTEERIKDCLLRI